MLSTFLFLEVWVGFSGDPLVMFPLLYRRRFQISRSPRLRSPDSLRGELSLTLCLFWKSMWLGPQALLTRTHPCLSCSGRALPSCFYLTSRCWSSCLLPPCSLPSPSHSLTLFSAHGVWVWAPQFSLGFLHAGAPGTWQF